MKQNLVSVVLPTYCEAANLNIIVPDIMDALGADLGEIIIVDDNSPDDTRAVVDRMLRCKFPVQLHVRQHERGLASAIFYGIRAAWYERIIVMDADGQHPPELLPRIAMALNHADLVAATRRSDGGGDGHFGAMRKAISQGFNLLAAPLCPQSDRTGGYFGLRKAILTGVNTDAIGWKAGLEIYVKANYATYTEIPYEFGERWTGESKTRLKHGIEYVHHLSKLYSHKFSLKQLAQFCIVGATGVVVNMAVLTALVEGLGLDYRLGALAGIVLAMVSNFALNKRWTFKDGSKLKRRRVSA